VHPNAVLFICLVAISSRFPGICHKPFVDRVLLVELSQNSVFMNLLASFYPEKKVYAATVAQSTALGAALAVHNKWNTNSISSDLINLKYYKADFKIL